MQSNKSRLTGVEYREVNDMSLGAAPYIRWLSVRQAARYMNVNERTVYRWLQSGVLKYSKTDTGILRIAESDLVELRDSYVTRRPNFYIYVYDPLDNDDSKAKYKRFIHRVYDLEKIKVNECKVFIDTVDRHNRDNLFNHIDNSMSSVLYVQGISSLFDDLNDSTLYLLQRYLNRARCRVMVISN